MNKNRFYNTDYILLDYHRYCPYCGKELEEFEQYEGYDCTLYYNCNCKDALNAKDIKDRISLLERSLPRHKFGIKSCITKID